jgi:hypothetical protein
MTTATTTRTKRYTLADLGGVAQPWDDTRHEIIDGELFVSTQPADGGAGRGRRA